MQPVVTAAEMAAIDAEASEPVEELIRRAAWAVTQSAVELIGPSLYGKRIAVLAGKGNNGEDGRRAVAALERRGARCAVFPVGSEAVSGARPGGFDLVIDACFGTGFRGDFTRDVVPIDVGESLVLAVDIPSGVHPMTGSPMGDPIPATATVTFAALKPGLLLGPGRTLAGSVRVADIGLDCGRATIQHLEARDIPTLWPRRAFDHHKWRNAVLVVGGGPGMTGAPTLSATAALRAGAGYATLAIPGATATAIPTEPIEAVGGETPPAWAGPTLDRAGRHGAVVVGPGLTVDRAELGHYLEETTTPTVLDAGAIAALSELPEALSSSSPLHVVTPHDGEYERLTGSRPGQDRVGAARNAALGIGAVVLLKGSTTVVAHPDGRVLLSTSGDQRLATAGTGDVLSGIIGAGIAGGLDPFVAAGVAAELHGRAGSHGYRVGMTAGDLPSAVAAVLSQSKYQSKYQS